MITNKILILFLFPVLMASGESDSLGAKLINTNYPMMLVSLGDYSALKEEGHVWVDGRSLLRSAGTFSRKLDGKVAVDSFAEMLVDQYNHYIGPNQLVLVVVRRNSIQRFYYSGKGVPLDPAIDYYLEAGDIILLGVR